MSTTDSPSGEHAADEEATFDEAATHGEAEHRRVRTPFQGAHLRPGLDDRASGGASDAATELAASEEEPGRRRGLRVAVFGAGIAGLTAAHELAERGFKVHVFEPTLDERSDEGYFLQEESTRKGHEPPRVKVGGMAASQWAFVEKEDTTGYMHNFGWVQPTRQLAARPFTLDDEDPVPEQFENGMMLPGEHGFRFFPAYYLHIWDTMQRTPVYEPVLRKHVEPGNPEPVIEYEYVATHQSVYDNVERVITQGTTTMSPNVANLIFARESPRTWAELTSQLEIVYELGFEPSDVSKLLQRLARYLATSPARRRAEMQFMSPYDYFTDIDPTDFHQRVTYSRVFDQQLRDMPKVLAALDAIYGDARTNVSTYLQLQLRMDRRDNKADGILNGPTSDAWFDHWYRHLVQMGVEFFYAELDGFEFGADGPLAVAVNWRLGGDDRDSSRWKETIGEEATAAGFPRQDGDPRRFAEHYDYVVVATDAATAETATRDLRPVVGGTVAGLEGFTTLVPSDDPPSRFPGDITPAHDRGCGTDDENAGGSLRERLPAARFRDPRDVREMGVKKWDRFQTLAGVQFYFDTEFQLVRGHMYFTGSEWGLSSINQAGLWHFQPYPYRKEGLVANGTHRGYASVLSVDIGDWQRESSVLGTSAIEATDDDIAREVWRQICEALANSSGSPPLSIFPTPVLYTIDRNLQVDRKGKITHNHAPYLVPIVNDWDERPGGPPWNPLGSSISYPPTADARNEMSNQKYWEAEHGGYQVHCEKLVFAGTWTRTFTRMTTMEAANESARHAVNAILDHLREGARRSTDDGASNDLEDGNGLRWQIPFGFLDQQGSSPVRQPTPLGDYCFIYDLENREPAEFRDIRNLDAEFFEQGLPHPWDLLGIDTLSRMTTPSTSTGRPTLPSLGQVINDVRDWRQYMENMWQLSGAGGNGPESGSSPRRSRESGTQPGGRKARSARESPSGREVPFGREERPPTRSESGIPSAWRRRSRPRSRVYRGNPDRIDD